MTQRHIQQFGSITSTGDIREISLLRLLQDMTAIAPWVFKFSRDAGFTGMSHYVGEPDIAEDHLYNVVRGKASKDSNAKGKELFDAKRAYAKVLAVNGKYKESYSEFTGVLLEDNLDFLAAFSLLEIDALPGNIKDITKALQASEDIFAGIKSISANYYTGYSPAITDSDWLYPLRYFPKYDNFNDYVKQRKPIHVRLSRSSLQSIFQGIDWVEALRLENGLNENEASKFVQVECRKRSTTENDQDAGLKTFSKVMRLDEFVRDFYAENTTCNLLGYEHEVGPPVNDFPFSVKSDVLKDVGVVKGSLWLSRSVAETTSQLRYDHRDSLYVAVEGSKTFRLLSPSYAHKVRTVSPTYLVSPDGTPFQYHFESEFDTVLGIKSISPYARTRNDTFNIATMNDHRPSGGFGTNPEAREELLAAFTSVTLQPGDVLYIPSGWYYEVKSYR